MAIRFGITLIFGNLKKLVFLKSFLRVNLKFLNKFAAENYLTRELLRDFFN